MVGQTISHCMILEKIGQGGMGKEYRAEDTNLKREVTIKVWLEQFRRTLSGWPLMIAKFIPLSPHKTLIGS
ncbi:hypothetical protein MYX82_05530 [Acidobacteria bacterium AH-259-D05]|nr:hypothetical protein [Acidobacteria bacterium AH-259-D05]